MNLAGQTSLVTGASSGIGAAFADTFAAREILGDHLDPDSVALLETRGRLAQPLL